MKNKLISFVLMICLLASVSAIPTTKAKAAESPNFIEVEPFEIPNRDGFDEGLKENINKIQSGKIQVAKDSEDASSVYFKFTLKEDAIVTAYYGLVESTGAGENLDIRYQMFGNEQLTIPIGESLYFDKTSSKTIRVYLKKGTYYVRGEGKWGDYKLPQEDALNDATFAIAYVETKGKPSDFTLSVNTKKTTANNVIVTVKTNDPDATIDVGYYQYTIEAENKMDSEKQMNQFALEQNGPYIIRVHSSVGSDSSEQKITIKNIDKTRPATPEPTTYEKNSKKIIGKEEAGVLVNATIGKKTYSAVTRDNGVFTITTPNLKKGTKITLQATDAVGNKSDKKTVTVK